MLKMLLPGLIIVFCLASTAEAVCLRTPGVTPPDPDSSWYSCKAVPSEIEIMGSDYWQNANGGGIQFVTKSMPDSIAIFLIRPTDSGLEMMASQLSNAKQNGDSIQVQFKQVDPNHFYGNVISIRFFGP